MKILLTNDDGIHAKGIHSLIEELAKVGEVYLVAPDRERSGTGHSITVFEPIKVVEAKLPGIKAGWIVGGTPVDCVKLAMCKLIKDIDIVVSGINHGPNLGTDVLYSGTVSAAAEGIIMGVPSIAVSLDSYDPDMNFKFASKFTRSVVEFVMKNEIDRTTLLNINIPYNPNDRVKGIRITKLGVRNYDNLFEERRDPRGNIYYWLGGGVKEEEQEQDSDVVAVQEGYISITPINLDLTDYNLIQQYKKKFADYFDWE